MSDLNLSAAISAAVAAKMTPEFIEKEIDIRVGKLIEGAVESALRTYSDTGKLTTEKVTDALRVDKLDLPAYGSVVTAMLKEQIEARVAPLVAGQLAADMAELLNLAPKEIKLSEIADEMRKEHEDGYGPVITVILDHHDYGSTSIYLDDRDVHEYKDKHRCEYTMHVGSDGKILGATLREKDLKSTARIGRDYGLGQKIRAWYACGTTIILDEDAVQTAVGDY